MTRCRFRLGGPLRRVFVLQRGFCLKFILTVNVVKCFATLSHKSVDWRQLSKTRRRLCVFSGPLLYTVSLFSLSVSVDLSICLSVSFSFSLPLSIPVTFSPLFSSFYLSLLLSVSRCLLLPSFVLSIYLFLCLLLAVPLSLSVFFRPLSPPSRRCISLFHLNGNCDLIVSRARKLPWRWSVEEEWPNQALSSIRMSTVVTFHSEWLNMSFRILEC